MKFNTALTVVTLLSLAGSCSAVKFVNSETNLTDEEIETLSRLLFKDENRDKERNTFIYNSEDLKNYEFSEFDKKHLENLLQDDGLSADHIHNALKIAEADKAVSSLKSSVDLLCATISARFGSGPTPLGITNTKAPESKEGDESRRSDTLGGHEVHQLLSTDLNGETKIHRNDPPVENEDTETSEKVASEVPHKKDVKRSNLLNTNEKRKRSESIDNANAKGNAGTRKSSSLKPNTYDNAIRDIGTDNFTNPENNGESMDTTLNGNSNASELEGVEKSHWERYKILYFGVIALSVTSIAAYFLINKSENDETDL